MEWNDETLRNLTQFFANKVSTKKDMKRRGKRELTDAAKKPNYGVCVLRLVAEGAVAEKIRECAAVNFTNHLIRRWVPSSAAPITDGEKEEIKTLIVPLILSATPTIRNELSKALAVIGNDDFAMVWSVLLPEIKSNLDKALIQNDYAAIDGNLAVVNFVLKTFEDHFMSDLSRLDSAMLSNTIERVLRVLRKKKVATLCLLIEAQRVYFRILSWPSFLDIPLFLKENADKWMEEFSNYLTMSYLKTMDRNLTCDEKVGVAAFKNTQHIDMGKKLSQKYLHEFVEAVWRLLVNASKLPGCEQLTMAAIKFLTIVSTSGHHALLAGDEILQKITQSIFIPKVMFRDEDENVELYEMEGSKVDTRRRIVCELLKGIAVNYKEKVTARVSKQIDSWLAVSATNWECKECAIYLVVSFSTISTDLVDVESFFRSVIVPELQDPNDFPMLKVGALKFLTTFRVLIPKVGLGDVVRFVASDVNVVHSYAAICIEKLLLMKDTGGVQRYTSSDISPLFLGLMSKLFGALEKPGSEGNQYIMRCIMRVLQIADISSKEAASPCLTELAKLLEKVCLNAEKRPRVFNHCLFEAVVTLGERACKKNPSLLPDFERCLRENIRDITCNDVEDLYPYACQFLAQLVSIKKGPEKKPWWIYDITLTLDDWNESRNVPSLIRWFQSLLQQGVNVLVNERVVVHMLDYAKKHMSSPDAEQQGFKLLGIVIVNVHYDVLRKHIVGIWDSVYTRLQPNITTTSVMHVITFMSLFVVRHGTHNLPDLINSKVGGSSLHEILGQFWIPTLNTITGLGYIEVKLSAVASTKLLFESASLLDPAAEELWGKLLDGIVTLLSQPQQQEEEEEEDDEPDGYRLLRYSGWKEEDPLKEILDPKHYLMFLLAVHFAQFRGKFLPLITKYLSPANQAAVVRLCIFYNLAIV